MALPSSGTMKASMIREELKETGTWSINAKSSRDLAKVPSGMIKFSDFYGKSNALWCCSMTVGVDRYRDYIGFYKNDFGSINPDNLYVDGVTKTPIPISDIKVNIVGEVTITFTEPLQLYYWNPDMIKISIDGIFNINCRETASHVYPAKFSMYASIIPNTEYWNYLEHKMNKNETVNICIIDAGRL